MATVIHVQVVVQALVVVGRWRALLDFGLEKEVLAYYTKLTKRVGIQFIASSS